MLGAASLRIPELAESQASERTIMSIAGHVSPKMLDHYSHILIQVKRQALDALSAKPVREGYDTKDGTNPIPSGLPSFQVTEKNGGDDGTRTRDLCRDRVPFYHWRTQTQQVTRAVVGTRWLGWAWVARLCSTNCSTTACNWGLTWYN